MSLALDHRDDDIVEADDQARVHFTAPHAHTRFVKVVKNDGSIHLIPWDHLDEAERALLLDPQLRKDTVAGIAAFKAGEGVSSDWLFADE